MTVRMMTAAGALVASLAFTVSSVSAQSISVGGKDVQFHGSFQQGFAISDTNNFLTMDTTAGSGQMTDGAFNVSSQVTHKLRVGAQLYTRKIGEFGEGQVQFDWAYADYRFAKAFGVRGGKMKTMLGLFNDTQDMEFLYTWALLPQGVYPLDLRAVTIAHVGADAYGTLGGKKVGSFSYTVHYGEIPDDTKGGYRYGINDQGIQVDQAIKTTGWGADMRWNAPIDGLLAGYSLMVSHADTHVLVPAGPRIVPVEVDVTPWRRQALFADYQHDALRLSAEVRKDLRTQNYTPQIRPNLSYDSLGWFAAGSYRFGTHFEAGSYVTRYVPNQAGDTTPSSNHELDRVVTARFDINKWWNVKVEGHFMDGYGTLNSSFAHGFYLRDNATPSAQTNMLVVRTGINF
jgi:hypothetical protein